VVTAQEALAELLRLLQNAQYQFVAVTPGTHATVLTRGAPAPLSLRDIFGWNRPFEPSNLSPRVMELLRASDTLEPLDGGKLRSRVRVASLGPDLVLHSAFPTNDMNSVFFGPDTYRFARFLHQQLPQVGKVEWLVDMGAGSGAGAIVAARLRDIARITMVDMNAEALKLAAINAAAAGVRAETLLSHQVPTGPDLIIANPPYMLDAAGRSYRDGGGLTGGAVALEWAEQALARLVPGGGMLLYTGAAFIDGRAELLDQMAVACANVHASLELTEIDPDVFGEELKLPHYERVERIAAVGAVIRTPGR
jgi:hypothetical protein